MNDIELQALIAIVAYETAQINADVAKYGEQQMQPATLPYRALYGEMLRRGKLAA